MNERYGRWRINRQGALPQPVSAWVRERGSLTRRLRALSAGTLAVQVVHNGWALPWPEERRRLKMPPHRWGWVRMVILRGHGQPWVFARTVLPQATLTGAQRRLAHIGTRPLGEILFRDPTLQRGQLETVAVLPTHPAWATIAGLCALPEEPLWGRRSIFWLARKPLLVSEFFLPGLWRER